MQQFLYRVHEFVRESYRTRKPAPFAIPTQKAPHVSPADCTLCKCVRVGGGFITIGWTDTPDDLCPCCHRFIDLNLAKKEAVGLGLVMQLHLAHHATQVYSSHTQPLPAPSSSVT